MGKRNKPKESHQSNDLYKPIIKPAASSHPRLVQNGYVSIKECRHGIFMYNLNDLFISRSLDIYGEWCNSEIDSLGQLIRKGDVVVDIGANIGTHTVFFGKAVTQEGKVFAFEPQRVIFEFLCANIALNGLINVKPMNMGVGEKNDKLNVPVLNPAVAQNFGGFGIQGHEQGDVVDIIPLDQLELERCNLIKIDVEGMECSVIKGAEKTIKKCRPYIFVENNSPDGAPELIKTLINDDYECWWHIANYYNPNNYFKNPENCWPNLVPEANMLCLPKEQKVNITGFEKVLDENDNWIEAVKRLQEKKMK
jgi:FkbM family methyltransferase